MRFALADVMFAYHSRGAEARTIFDQMSLVVGSGERIGVLGEEGTGKSTLLQLMVGLLRPEKGTVTIEGEDIWEQRNAVSSLRRDIGFAFQFPEQQFLCETVGAELGFTSKNRGVKPSVQPEDVLRAFGIGSEKILDRSPFSLSLGEARRVALASLLVSSPRALLLDEPTAGLDAAGVHQTLSAFGHLVGRNVTMVIVSHDVDFLTELVDRIIVLQGGSAYLDCPARELLTDTVKMEALGYQVPEVVQVVQEAIRKGIRIDPGIRTKAEVMRALQETQRG